MTAAAFSAQLPAGCILGRRYEVRAPIATGGMGCIYLARSLTLDAAVAVKVLRPELSTSPTAVDRFQREALLAADLRHPNIVEVIDFGRSDDGLHYLVMEYLPGRSVAEIVRGEGPQPIARALPIMVQLLAALEELHANGIAHGDVSSENLLLQPTIDGSPHLKLVDFGLARRLSIVDRASSPNDSELEVCGTPGYMAPEVIHGDGPGVAADMYAAGVVLHELLTGELPYAASSPTEVMARQLAGAIEPLSLRFPLLGIPSELDTLVARELSLESVDRLAAADLIAALELAALGHGPVSSGSGAGPEARRARRDPVRARGTPDAREMRTTAQDPAITARVERAIHVARQLRGGVGNGMR